MARRTPTPPPPTTNGQRRNIPVDGRYYDATLSADLTLPQRCAQYLDACAKQYPFQLIRYDEIFRNIQLLPRRQQNRNIGEADLKRTKAHVRAANRWLQKYHRTIVLGEMGARASVDDQDVVEAVAPRKAARIQSAVKTAQEMDAIIDTKQLENNDMGRWYRGTFKPALGALQKIRQQLTEAAPEAKQLPPGPAGRRTEAERTP